MEESAGPSTPKKSREEKNNKGELTAYIHKVSPVKTSKRGFSYCNFEVQTQDNVHQGVSFKSEFRQTLVTAANNKSPVRLSGFKRKANYKDNTLQDIEINRQTTITLLDSANFKYVTQNKPSATTTDVKSIKDCGYEKQLISLLGFVNIDNCYQSTYNDTSRFKEVYFNDSDLITLTLWNEYIEQVPQSGAYSITNVIVKKRLDTTEELYVNTTKETTISKSPKKIKAIKPTFDLFSVQSFPIKTFEFTSRKFKCIKCSASIENITPGQNFLTCHCGMSSRYVDLPILRSARVMFENGCEAIFYDSQLKEYGIKKGVRLDSETEFTEAMLTDASTQTVVNRRGICVSVL